MAEEVGPVTREDWKQHVDALAASGMTVAAYAAKAGVHPGTLAAWRSKLRGGAPAAKSKQVTFIEVQPPVPVSAPEVGTIELVVGDVRIMLRGRVETDALAPVLAALEGRR